MASTNSKQEEERDDQHSNHDAATRGTNTSSIILGDEDASSSCVRESSDDNAPGDHEDIHAAETSISDDSIKKEQHQEHQEHVAHSSFAPPPLIQNVSNSSQGRPDLLYRDCCEYVANVKRRLHGLDESGKKSYDQFIHILETWVKRGLTWKEVFSEMFLILKDTPDLLEEFPKFLPANVQDQAMLEIAARRSQPLGEENAGDR
jgi:histone deacetylase complex regulatory component SIN3